ncbi:MAG TPA: DUF4942 domain-containing protein [Candidatus Paceibacterota bacterium]
MLNDIEEFYPTPANLIHKMLSGIDFMFITSVLEPSAGKGDLIDAIRNKFKNERRYGYNSKNSDYDIDTIEIDTNLQHILKGKEYRLVSDDFLKYDTYKRYSLIIMNPPFLNGNLHLAKAIEMQQHGGKIVCLLNAETLKNPYSNNRKDLVRKLEELNATIEYISDAFIVAERKTGVEIALIKIDIPAQQNESYILTGLREKHEQERITESITGIIKKDFVTNIIDQYKLEIEAGIGLIEEYEAMQPFILKNLKEKNSNPILSLVVDVEHNNRDHLRINDYVKMVRRKYWSALFNNPDFMNMLTSNLREEYHNRVNKLVDYDFSLYNIQSVQVEMMSKVTRGVDDTILSLFDEFSHKHNWYDETSKNIHYFNGWKTNKGWKINKKVIIPLAGFDSWSKSLDFDYKTINKLEDVEKVFNYLDGGVTENVDIREILKQAKKDNISAKIELKFFRATFFKKGTCHLEFLNMDLLDRFNIFGSTKKGWLPPAYGKKKYKDMDIEEKSVIDEFQGEENYNKVMNNKDYYIVNTASLLMIGA